MSQDHYVAQTYLRKWCDPANRDHMHVYRKSNLKHFLAHPYTVCREKDGDKIAGWLDDESALGEFRALVEPGWDKAVEAAAQRRLTAGDKLLISGYWANLMATPPAMQALGIDFFKSKNEEFLAQQVAKGISPPESVKDANSGTTFDTDFIKAVATESLFAFTWQFYNISWLVFINDTPHPFLTSDNPAGGVPAPPGHAAIHILPLSPRLCIWTFANKWIEPPKTTPSSQPSPMGDIQYRVAKNIQAKAINRTIVINARELVFSVKADSGIATLVEKYRNHDMQMYSAEVSTDDGVSTIRGMYIARNK